MLRSPRAACPEPLPQRRRAVCSASSLPPVTERVASADQRSAHPALVRLPDDPRLRAEDAAGEPEVGSLPGAWVDVDAADADRRRAEEAQPLRRLPVGYVHQLDPRLEPLLAAQPLDQRERRLVIRAAIEIQHLHQRPLPGALLALSCDRRRFRRATLVI